ncbi:class I SAM-dependent RNA methyltransferase [Falsiruegeria mediterranea]|uniref:23S rRNA (Uracil(1939)-C(5))-methyltransferase RlmD n=1 Tax=Falsiruegeria mediterranea M17 TaxID=1200281 RepID=A0A2R8C3U6_9RHOB|nr:class I SAM-dependent RNA methyltransferase [Falsiruegeria mediterranea]SPJ27046.1 23S rRNA (uracil(1939)-C(5))-methyltransferase RlmD [Falsiruegeria mediterranea M17]
MTQQYTIARLGHQGDGIADGPIFAPRTLPGEVVTGGVEGQQLTDIRIETPSDDRVKPPCRHYKACGGCQLQHASDPFVAAWKVDIVRAALAAQGIEAEMRPIHTSLPHSRRRATIAVRRTKKGTLAGFHGRASDVITEIPDCHLLAPELLAAIPVAEALAVLGGSRKGILAVTLTLSSAGLDVSVQGGKPLDGPLEASLAQAAEQQGLARLAWDGEVLAMRNPPYQQFGAAKVAPPPGAFLQATKDGEAALLSTVQEIVAGSKKIVDLFAGCGTFSLPLAADAEVHAVEGEPTMTQALDQGWRMAQGLKRITTEARDLFRRPLMPDELRKVDAVVLDPPRAGAEAQVAELAQAQVPVIAYVSCNPVTFARDAKAIVTAGYTLNWVQVVDQFRWSAHTELAASFTLSHISG